MNSQQPPFFQPSVDRINRNQAFRETFIIGELTDETLVGYCMPSGVIYLNRLMTDEEEEVREYDYTKKEWYDYTVHPYKTMSWNKILKKWQAIFDKWYYLNKGSALLDDHFATYAASPYKPASPETPIPDDGKNRSLDEFM